MVPPVPASLLQGVAREVESDSIDGVKVGEATACDFVIENGFKDGIIGILCICFWRER